MSILVVFVILITLYFLFRNRFVPHLDEHEPPLLWPSLPFIGHMIGLYNYGSRYFQITSIKSKSPIYTLPMLTGKIYVVTSIDLVNAVNRNSNILALNPFIAQLGKRITGHDEATSQVVQHNLNGEDGPGYVTDIHDQTVVSLAPGPGLESMTQAMVAEASKYFRQLKQDHVVDLFAWVRHMVTMCSTRAVYGPGNPFDQDEERLVKAFWDFDHDLNWLIINLAPQLLVRKGFQARSELGAAFQRYYEQYSPEQANSAPIIKARHLINSQYGLTPWNQGRLEVGILLGILANTIPSTFYSLVHVFSDEDLLRDIRKEIEETKSVTYDAVKGKSRPCLRINILREKCVLLHSTFQEVLRLHALGGSSRFVREDILLQDRFLLKKGGVVMMPMAVMHSDPSTWGADAHIFQARRFLKSSSKNSAEQHSKNNAAAYRPFGGGTSLCPGRHFVTWEVMTLVAIFAVQFDITPVADADSTKAEGRSKCKWTIPPQKQESMATNVFPPEHDIRVRITEREGFKGTKWDFSTT